MLTRPRWSRKLLAVLCNQGTASAASLSVRCAERAQWRGAGRLQIPPSASGGSAFPARDFTASATTMPPTAILRSRLGWQRGRAEHALHPDLQLLAEPGRTILCTDHRQSHPLWLVHQCQTARAAHRSLRRGIQLELPAVQVDRHRRFHSRKVASTLLTYQRDSTLAPGLAQKNRSSTQLQMSKSINKAVTWPSPCNG